MVVPHGNSTLVLLKGFKVEMWDVPISSPSFNDTITHIHSFPCLVLSTFQEIHTLHRRRKKQNLGRTKLLNASIYHIVRLG